jgi:hypothetical protein
MACEPGFTLSDLNRLYFRHTHFSPKAELTEADSIRERDFGFDFRMFA